MIERAEKAGFGVALLGHAALFAALSLRLLAPPIPVPPPEQAIEVSLAPDVALRQSAPPAPTPPAPSVAPEEGPPEEEEVPPTPTAKPVAAPTKPTPVKPAPLKPADPERLAKVVADAQQADADHAAKMAAKAAAHDAWVEKVKAANAAKADAARLAAEKAQADKATAALARADAAKAAAARADAAKAAAVAKADAAKAAAAAKAEVAKAAARPRGSRLGKDFLKGLADTPVKTPSAAAPGAVMSAIAAADIQSAIQRQIQPCADRQVNPGPGAERIKVDLNLKLGRDGSLIAAPRVVNHSGTDVENRRYLDRVDDLAIAAFTGCAPLRGLPANLYDVPNGWRSITMRYKLPG